MCKRHQPNCITWHTLAEKQKHIKNQILSAVNSRIEDLQKVLARSNKMMQENFRHFFYYESKETYKAVYLLEKYNELLKDVKETSTLDELRNLIKAGSDFYLRVLTGQELYASTSNTMVNLAKNMEMESAQVLYQFYTHLYEYKLKQK